MAEERLCLPVMDGGRMQPYLCPVSGLAVPCRGPMFSLRLFSLGLEKLMKAFFPLNLTSAEQGWE